MSDVTSEEERRLGAAKTFDFIYTDTVQSPGLLEQEPASINRISGRSLIIFDACCPHSENLREFSVELCDFLDNYHCYVSKDK